MLPKALPIPVDDRSADHLTGLHMPSFSLSATGGESVRLDRMGSGFTILYGYPMTGIPGIALPDGWDSIPGARGCTPQACGFRDHFSEILARGATVYGISTQSTAYQEEMVERLHLPLPVLSDSEFALTDALRLPTMEVHGVRLLKRITLFVNDSEIKHCIYPVFPPDKSAEEALGWLRSQT